MWFERNFSFRIGPHLLRGRVDRVDRHPDGSYELIDYKTGRARTPVAAQGRRPALALPDRRARVVEARLLAPELLLRARRRAGAARAHRGGRSASRDTATEVARASSPRTSSRSRPSRLLDLRLPADLPGRGEIAGGTARSYCPSSPCSRRKRSNSRAIESPRGKVAERDLRLVHLLLEPLDQHPHLGLARDRLVEPPLVLDRGLLEVGHVDRDARAGPGAAPAARASPSGSERPRRSAAPAPTGSRPAARPRARVLHDADDARRALVARRGEPEPLRQLGVGRRCR